MKSLFLIIGFSLISTLALCQEDDVLHVATLTPNKVNIPNNLTKLLQVYQINCIQPSADFITEKYDSLLTAIEGDPNLDLNLKEHVKNQIESSINLNDAKNYSLSKAGSIQNFLTYKDANILARFFDVKSDGTLNSLKRIADSLNVRYIVNFPSIEYQKDDKLIAINARTQLYDNKHETIVIDEISEHPNSTGGSTKQTCTYENKEIVIVHSDSWIFRKVLFAILNDETENILNEEIERKQRDSTKAVNFNIIKQILSDNWISDSGLIDGSLNKEGTYFMAFMANSTTGKRNKCQTKYSILIGRKNDYIWSIKTLSSDEIKTECSEEPTVDDVFDNIDEARLKDFLENG